MKPIGKIIGLGLLGCLACCGGPAVLLLLGGMSADAAFGELLHYYHHPLSVAIAGVGAATFLALVLSRWRTRKAARCVCPPYRRNRNDKEQNDGTLPIACTLTPTDFIARLAELNSLTKDALISGWRDGLTLHLRYRPEAEDRVRRMVEHEQEGSVAKFRYPRKHWLRGGGI